MPSRLTTAAHSLLSRPPLLGPPLGFTLFFRISANRSCSTGHDELLGAWAATGDAANTASIAPEIKTLCIGSSSSEASHGRRLNKVSGARFLFWKRRRARRRAGQRQPAVREEQASAGVEGAHRNPH